MDEGRRNKKQAGLIVSYYLSRCNMEAVKSLGYKNFTEAFQQSDIF